MDKIKKSFLVLAGALLSVLLTIALGVGIGWIAGGVALAAIAIILGIGVIGVILGLYVLVARVAQEQNRNVVVWLLLSFFTSPLLILLILLAIGKNEKYTGNQL